MSARSHKRVSLIIDSMTAPRRTMMNGVARFMQEHESWSVYLKPPFIESELLEWIRNWNGDGVIGRLTENEMEGLRKASIPFVDAAAISELDGVYKVRADDDAIGRIGAEHLIERGFKHFAFCEMDSSWAQRRLAGFQARLGESGFIPHRHLFLKPSARPSGPDAWDKKQQEMGEWLASLPKPVGVMATNDFLGMQVLEACQRFGLSVPFTVAVLGADNDEPICRISTPPLSSVIINDEQRGYEAASLLSELMSGKTPKKATVLISPSGVKARASTDVFAFDDDLMVSAMRYLREHVDQPADVAKMADVLQISRSTLDRKFRKILGRSVNDEVVRLRLEKAIRLLSETQLPLKSIAFRCGFSSQAYMSSVFKSKVARTPNSYRH